MARAAYIGAANLTRKAKKMYVGDSNGIARKVKKGYVGVNIPETAYGTRLEYIETSGTQYIDTGLLVEKEDSYEYILDVHYVDGDSAYGGANGYMQFLSSICDGVRTVVRIVYEKQVETVYVDDVQVSTQDWSTAYSGVNVKLGIMKMGNANNAWYSGSGQSGKLYSAQVKKDGVLVRDYIAFMGLDGEIGLYDRIAAKFYANVGSGMFTGGAEIETLMHAARVNVAKVFFSGGANAVYTGTHTIEQIDIDGVAYNLLTMTGSGVLTVEGEGVQVWCCGGGGNGAAPVNGSGGGGGAGGYVGSGALTDNTYVVTIGAKCGNTDILCGGETVISALCGSSGSSYGKGGDGGSGGGSGSPYEDPGSGAGISTYPFGLTSLYAHCAGGGGGGYLAGSAGIYYQGGTGGSKGAAGSRATRSSSQGGDGGDKGGGRGSNNLDSYSSTAVTGNTNKNASFYGSGGGGGGNDNDVAFYSGGSGYQGVAYALWPVA